MKKTAIIVLHYGDIQDTLDCLTSLQKIKDEAFSVYVVDNGTGSISTTNLRRFSHKPTLLINKRNLGYAGGNNIGIKQAIRNKHPYILLLNNDTTVSPTIIREMLSPFEDKGIGITGCVITYVNEPQRIWFAGGRLNRTFCITRHPFMNRSLPDISIKKGKTGFVTGAAMMVKREVFQKIGLLEEEYFLYWEDVDFCYRAEKAGYSSYLVNQPLVQHSVSSSAGEKGSNRLSPIRAYYYARNPFIFMKKNNLKKISGTIGRMIILPYFITMANGPKAIFSFMRGTFDGIRATL